MHRTLPFIFLVIILHFAVGIPVLLAAAISLALWVLWKLKYIILAIIGLEWLFSQD